MSDVFDIKRFGRYAAMHYMGSAKKYLTFCIYLFIGIVALCVGMKFSGANFGGEYSAFSDVQRDFYQGYAVLAVATIWGFSAASLKGYYNTNLSMKDLLMPVSTFERYIFTILNSTVVAFVLFNIVFMIGSNYAESLFFFSDNLEMCSYRGVFGNSTIPLNESFTQLDIFSYRGLFDYYFGNDVSDAPYFTAWFMIYGALGVISINMWGVVTFQKGGEFISALIHGGILILFIYLIYLVSNQIIEPFARNFYGIYFSDDYVSSERTLVHIFAIPVVVYQWVIWRKLKCLTPKN